MTNLLFLSKVKNIMSNNFKRIAVIGATGLAGSTVVEDALQKGYKVVAVVRNPDKVKNNDKLITAKGDVLDYDSLQEAFKNVDAVISCIGPKDDFKPGTLMSEGIANIVLACEANRVEKFIMMSGILQSDGKTFALLDRLVLKLIQRIYRKVVRDKITAEKIVQKSSLKWVIVRPVGLQATGEMEESVKAAPDIAVSPLKRISVKTCASQLLKAVEEPKWEKQIIHVGK